MQHKQCNYYEEAFQQLNEAVFVSTEEKIIWCNQNAANLLGYDTPDQIIGRPNTMFLDQEYHKKSNMLTETLFKTGDGQNGLFRLLRRDGTGITCAVKGSLVKTGSGRYMVTIPRLVSLSSIDMRLVKFLEKFKHEINDPLYVIWGYNELLRENHELTPEVHQFLEIIGDNILRLKNICEATATLENLMKE